MIHWTDEELAQMKEWDKLVMRGGCDLRIHKPMGDKERNRKYYLAHREQIRARRKENYWKKKEEKA
jgi:hypothetical protein